MCCPWPNLPMITQSAGPWECPLLKQWAGDWHTSLPCIRLASPIQGQDRAHMLMCMLNIHSYRCALAHIITRWWWQTNDMMSYQSSFCTISMRSFSLDVMTLLFFIHVECFTSCALHIHLTPLVSCICFVLWFSPSRGLQYQYFHYGIIYCALIWCYFFFRFILALCPALCIYMLVCSDFAAPPQCSSTLFSRQLLLPCHYCHILLHFLVMERFLDLLEPLLPPFSHLVSSPSVWIVSFLWIPCLFVLLFVALI